MAQPEDLGSLLLPGDLKENEMYYFMRVKLVPGPSMLSGRSYEKVTIIKITVSVSSEGRLMYQIDFLNSAGKLKSAMYITNAATGKYSGSVFSGRFYSIDTERTQAQINTMRNLGRYGKVPMNIAMHKLPTYLGLGGKRRTRRRKAKK